MLKMPKLPDNFRWQVEYDESRYGVPRFKVTLLKKSWIFYKVELSRDTGSYSSDSAIYELAEDMWRFYNEKQDLLKKEGIYDGND